jgi:hypothetical protein
MGDSSSSSDSSDSSDSSKSSNIFGLESSDSSDSSDSSSKSKGKGWFGFGDNSSKSSESSSDSSNDSSSSDSRSGKKKRGLWDILTGADISESSDSSDSSSEKTGSNTGKGIIKTLSNILHGNTILERFVFVILVIICFVIMLSVGSNILSAILEPENPYLIDGLYTASNGTIIAQDPIARSDNETFGIEFTWSIWLNVTSLEDSKGNSSQYKHVFSKGDNNNVPVDSRGINAPNNSPGLYIDKNTNSIVVIMNTFEQIEEMITVTDVPLNKWVNVLIRVEGAYFDVYINGTLAKRKVLNSVPKQNNGKVYVCQNGGFSGFISNLRYFKKALEPGDILNISNSGPNLKTSKIEKQYLKSGESNYFAMDWYFNNAAY